MKTSINLILTLFYSLYQIVITVSGEETLDNNLTEIDITRTDPGILEDATLDTVINIFIYLINLIHHHHQPSPIRYHHHTGLFQNSGMV